jgi:AcrR family transcriptional regulator
LLKPEPKEPGGKAAEPLRTGLLPASSEPVERLLEAAEEIFCGSGYAAASMREIAEGAGASKSLLHYHFQSKEHLFLEVLVRIYNRLMEHIAVSVEGRGDAEERGRVAIDALFEVLRENPDFQAQAKVWARSVSNAELLVHARRMRERLRAQIVETLRRIVGAERDAVVVDIEALADLLWATVTGLGLQSATDDGPERVQAALEMLRHLFSIALGAHKAGPEGAPEAGLEAEAETSQ